MVASIDVDHHGLGDLGDDEAQQLLDAFVERAVLERSSRGPQTGAYAQVLQSVDECVDALAAGSGDPADESNLAGILLAVQRCVSALRADSHDALVAKVLALRPWACPPLLRSALLSLVSHMAVSSGQLLPHCLSKLVEWLLPSRGAPLGLSSTQGPWSPPSAALDVQDHVMACLSHVVARVPSCSEHVAHLAVESAPPRQSDRDALCLHLRGLLALAESPPCAAVASVVLKGVIELLLSVDVEIKWEDIVEGGAVEGATAEEVAGEKDEGDIFELEGMTELQIAAEHHAIVKGAEDTGGGWEGAGAGVQGRKGGGVDEVADKMDSLMEQALAHLTRRIDATKASTSASSRFWEDIWDVFEAALLPTHRSKFTQFFIFHALAAGPPEWRGRFLQGLVGLMMERSRPGVLRCACAAYLGSFLARATFLAESLVVEALEAVVLWCLKEVQERGAGDAAGDRVKGSRFRSHMTVYGDGGADDESGHLLALHAAVQAVLYVLCYHMEPLLSSDGHLPGSAAAPQERPKLAKAVRKLVTGPLAQLLSSPLDPLSRCLPTVVREFSRLASRTGLLDIRGHPAVAGAGVPKQRAARPLETFFPFDPYLLRRSGAVLRLEETYVRWQKRHPRGPRGVDSESGGEERDGASETEDETSPSEDDASSADASSSSSSLVSMMHVGSMVSPPMASTGTPGSGAKRFGGRAFGHAPVALASRRRALEAMGVYGTSPAAVPSGATPQSDLSSMMGSMPMAGSSLGVHWRPAGALHQPR